MTPLWWLESSPTGAPVLLLPICPAMVSLGLCLPFVLTESPPSPGCPLTHYLPSPSPPRMSWHWLLYRVDRLRLTMHSHRKNTQEASGLPRRSHQSPEADSCLPRCPPSLHSPHGKIFTRHSVVSWMPCIQFPFILPSSFPHSTL